MGERGIIHYPQKRIIGLYVNEVAYELLEDIETEWLQKHKPRNKNSFSEMYKLRTEARLIAEEVVLHDVVNCFH